MTEMVGNAGRIAACVDIPVIADADTGYGNPLNVIRTVGAYEAAGVAGIHIEDQVAPKKCGHMEGKLVIPAEEMAAEGPGRGRGPHPARVRDHRPDRRAGRGGPGASPRARPDVPRGRGRRAVHRGRDQRGGSRGGGAGLPRRAAAVQLGRGGQDPADQPGPPAASWDTGSLSSRSARCWRRPGPCGGYCRRSPQAGTPAAAMRELPTFAEFVDFIGLPQVREAEQRYAVKRCAGAGDRRYGWQRRLSGPA